MFADGQFLWALMALAVPILVHLFHFRRPRVLLFSHVQFLVQVQHAVSQRLRVSRWLLLALRLLAVACIVLAFAGPSCHSQAEGGAAGRSVLLLLDDSPSMLLRDAGGERLQQARAAAKALVASLGPQDEVQVQALSRLREGMGFGTAVQAQLQTDELAAQPATTALARVVPRAAALFSQARNPQHELYVFSDFQRGAVLASETPSARTWPAQLRLRLVPVGQARVTGNLAVVGLSLADTLLAPDAPVRLRYVLRNEGAQTARQVPVQVQLGGQVVAADAVPEIGAGQSLAREVVLQPAAGGWQSGSIQVQDAAATYDNTRYFSLRAPQRLRLCLASDAPPQSFLTLYRDVLPGVDLQVLPTNQLSAERLTNVDGLILVDAEPDVSRAAAPLRDYLQRGGSLLYFPPADSAAPPSLHPALGLGSWGDLRSFTQPQPVQVAAQRHAVFQGMFLAPRKPASPQADAAPAFQVRRLWRYQPAAAGPATVLLQTAGGEPVLVEQTLGLGKVATFAMPEAAAATDFARSSLFAPLLYRLALHLAAADAPPLSYAAGNGPANVFLPTPDADEVLRIVPLDSAASAGTIPEQVPRPGGVVLQLGGRVQQAPGAYRVLQGDSLLRHLSVNLPDAESQLDFASPAQLQAFADSLAPGMAQVLRGTPDQVALRAQSSAVGVQAWWWLLLLALLLLLAEAAVHRWFVPPTAAATHLQTGSMPDAG